MTDLVDSVILGFAFLSAKHIVADFFLQTPYQFQNKGIYGHPGGLLHSSIHAVLTLPLFFILVPTTALLAIAVVIGEFVIHYHTDWFKEQIVQRNALTPQDFAFWQAFGVDQLVHLLTYVAMIAVLTR